MRCTRRRETVAGEYRRDGDVQVTRATALVARAAGTCVTARAAGTCVTARVAGVDVTARVAGIDRSTKEETG